MKFILSFHFTITLEFQLSCRRVKKMSRLTAYIPFVEFIGKFLGSDAEVILYDPYKSEVHYVYNALSEEVDVGSPMPTAERRFMEQEIYRKEDSIVNYRAFSADHSKLRSATHFIKDEDGELVGIVTINLKVDNLIEFRSVLNRLISGTEVPSADYYESFEPSFEDLMHKTIKDSLAKFNVPPERLTHDEKMELIRELDEKGIFLLKGSIAELSKILRLSETTIYRYINKL